jgi:hypothetical protein
VPLKPISVSGLFRSVATHGHAAPSSRMTAGSIDEEKRAGRTFAGFHVGEILRADEIRK